MSKDFKARQIRTSALIGSGTQSGQPGILIYSASDATNFSGNYQADMLTNVGSDVFLFVSGSKNKRSGITLFGGDIVVSGTVYMENLVAEVDLSTTGSALVSGSMFVSGGLSVNSSYNKISENDFTVYGESQHKTLIKTDVVGERVYILSGGSPSSNDQMSSTDTSFFVSGTIGSRGTSIKGTSVFGGDVVISGSLTDGDGNPIVGGGGGTSGDAVGWFSGSSATHGSLGIQPGFISTSGSLAVSGTFLDVSSNIRHIGDVSTKIEFPSDGSQIDIHAGGINKLSLTSSITIVNADGNDVDFQVNSKDQNRALIKGIAGTSDEQVLILSGGAASSYDEPSGADVAFYVSGSRLSAGTSTRGTAVIGGDTVISGALYVGSTEQDYLYVKKRIVHDGDDNTYISLVNDGIYQIASSSLFTFAQGNGDKYFAVNPVNSDIDFRVNADASGKRLIEAIAETGAERVLILSGGAPGSVDQSGGSDVAFYVSGTVGSSGTSTRGTSLFGGDVVVSGSERVEGDLNVAQYIRHIDDSDTYIEFTPNTQQMTVGGKVNVYSTYSATGPAAGKTLYILSGGAASSYDEASASDVAFYVSGALGGSGKNKSLFGGDVAVSGSLRGVKTTELSDFRELNVVSDRVAFGNSDSKSIGSEVFFYVSGASPIGGGGSPILAQFDGQIVTSGNLKIIQNYPVTGSHLTIANMTSVSGEGGSAKMHFSAGGDSDNFGDGSNFTITKYGPANSQAAGGPHANLLQAKSGSMVFALGNSDESSNIGTQGFGFRDMAGTFFLTTTGSDIGGDSRIYFMTQGNANEGLDANFVVSGSIGSSGTSTRGTALFGGDLTASGSVSAELGLSGSLTQLTDGSSYLIAGDNVTITSASNGSITIGAAAGGAGSLTTVSGSTSVSSVSSIDFSRLGYVMNLGGGSIAVTGTIGLPEDGTYADGLFNTFSSTTEIGHAIDKINEVLYYLAPSPAPNLSKIGNDGLSGTTPVLLSIGSTSTAGTSGYTLVGGSAGLGSAVDINETYQVVTASNNIRMGVFTSLQDITGDLADGVAQNAYANGIINYSGSAFGDADQGTLKLEINGTIVTGTPSVDLTDGDTGTGNPGGGSGTYLDGNNNGFFELSQTGSSVQSNGQEFGLFKYRTGKFRVAVGGGFQRTGWNYARVIHTVGSTDRTTNYIEWFNDTSNRGNPIVSNAEITNYTLSGSKFISGIEYATGAQGDYLSRIDNFYDNVYQQNAISFSTTNVDAVSSQNVPELNTSADSRLDSIHLTSSFQVSNSDISSGNLLSGSATFNFSVSHPTKTNMSATGSVESLHFLLFSGSSNANDQFEDFIYEDKRLVSASYDTQANLAASVALGYNSQYHVTSSELGYGDGLVFFGGKLKAPVNTTNSGDFTSFSSSTSRQNGAQPNYSGLTSGKRTFFRAFRNESGASTNNFKLTLTGSGTTIVHTGTALNSANVRVFVKNPEHTGWLDLGQSFKPVHLVGGFQVSDYDGLRIGSTFNDTLSGGTAVNYGSFGTGSLLNNEYMVLKFEADGAWTGNLEGLDVIFPAYNPGSIVQAPALDELDVSSPSDFVSAKLSFGTGKTTGGPANYIFVTGSSGAGGPYGYGADVDYNGNYTADTNIGSDKRYGVNSSNGATEDIVGNLNGDVSSNGQNYPADAFSYGHVGTLSLYVNASGSGVTPLHSVNLSTFPGAGNPGAGTGTSVNGNGSGFINMSLPTPAKSSGGLEDFRYFHRTGKFKVAGADQNAKGWNWAQVVHSVPGLPDTITSFVEWVNDDDGNAIQVVSSETGSMGSNSYYYQSGVKYFDTAVSTTGSVKFRVADAYTNVYSNSATALQFSLTNSTAQSMIISGSAINETEDSSLTSNGTSLPGLTSTGDITADIFVTGTITYTGGLSLPGDASPLNGFNTENMAVTLTAKHPIDANDNLQQVFTNMLSYSGSAGVSNLNTIERFTGEFYRAQSGSFANQSALASAGWDSTESLVGADAGHNTGLIIYGNNGSNTGYLISPKSSALPNGGNFITANDLTSPRNNVNYSSVSGERHFFRAFKNNTTSDQAVITLVVKGDATLVPRTGAGSASLGSNKNVYIFVKIPGKTGWLDVGKAADGTITDGGGALQGDRDATIDSGGASNEVTFSTAFIGGDPSSDGSGEHFCIAIHADADWTGYINEISVTY